MGDLGKTIGSGITAGLLALLGIDTGGAISDGKAIGGAFIDGFMDGFDTEQITTALKNWAGEHKGTVAALGIVLGGKLIGGVAKGVQQARGLVSTIQGILGKGSGAGGMAGAMGSSYATTSMRVTAGVVNVYGNMASNAANAAGAAGRNAMGGLPALPGGGGTPPALPGGTGGAAAAGGLTSASGWLGRLLQVGSKSSVVGADGTLLAVNGGIGGTLGSVGGALGSGATTAAGAAAAGTAAIGGGLLGGAGIISGLIDIFHGTKTSGKEAQTAYATGGSKIGMVGAGAAIGSVVPVIGTGVGALVGAGIGGLGALGFGDKIGQALSDALDEGGWLNNMGVAISGFFTETLPTKWGEFWDGVGNFFTETVPYALGFAAGRVTTFFTETIPSKLSEFWNGVTNFFTESIPAWWENAKTSAVEFFTVSLPSKLKPLFFLIYLVPVSQKTCRATLWNYEFYNASVDGPVANCRPGRGGSVNPETGVQKCTPVIFLSISSGGGYMSIQEILAGGGGVLVVVMTLVQFAPVKINPWSWLAKAIGRAINAGVSERLDAIESKLDAHVTMDDRRNADGHRTRILHFNNELLREIDHTKEEFIEALAEIDAYERYCEEHPEYPNNRAVLAIENIREVYKDRLKKHNFLQEGSSPPREAEE